MTRAPLNREAILDAALALADGNGLDALTMRALGSELGVEAPSLYKHVNGKEDILDGLTDRLYAQVRVGASEGPWPERMRVYAGALRRAILDHPNLAPLLATRPVFSPATLTLLEEALGELTDLDLAPQQAIQILDIVVGFVMGHALSELSAFDAGLDPQQLAKARALLPEEQFPRVRETLGKPIDRDAEFDLGMDLLISGIAGLIDS
jgi:TetR/AcrR family transcriptional regulator, tetracycline repressor protein